MSFYLNMLILLSTFFLLNISFSWSVGLFQSVLNLFKLLNAHPICSMSVLTTWVTPEYKAFLQTESFPTENLVQYFTVQL